MQKDALVEALLSLAETGETQLATAAMADAIEGCAGLHCTFTTMSGVRRQASYALTPSVVGERLKVDFQTPETNPIAAAFRRLAPGRMTPVEHFVDMRAYHESQLFQEMIEPYHTPNISSIMIPGRYGIVSFGLGQEAGVSGASLKLAERLAWHAARALDLHAMSQSPGDNAFLVDASGYLAGSPEISVERMTFGTLTQNGVRGRVRPFAKVMQAEFEIGLASAVTGQPGGLILPGDDGYAVRVRLLPGPTYEDRRVVWVHAECIDGPAWSAGGLAAVHGLTPRESSVVLALLKGADIPTIAAGLGLSDRSVRTYLSSAFTKVGVSSQAQLVRELLSH